MPARNYTCLCRGRVRSTIATWFDFCGTRARATDCRYTGSLCSTVRLPCDPAASRRYAPARTMLGTTENAEPGGAGCSFDRGGGFHSSPYRTPDDRSCLWRRRSTRFRPPGGAGTFSALWCTSRLHLWMQQRHHRSRHVPDGQITRRERRDFFGHTASHCTVEVSPYLDFLQSRAEAHAARFMWGDAL